MESSLKLAPAMVFRATADRQAVAVSYAGYVAELGASINGFVNQECGCEALAQR